MPRRPTFAQVLNSPLPKAIGKCSQDRTEVAAAVNEAQEILLMDPLAPDEGWWGGWATMLFNLYPTDHAAYLRTPAEIARVIVTDICQHPRFMRNGFYEYLSFGSGYQPKACGANTCSSQQVFDRDNVPTLVPFPDHAPQFIRIYPTDAADVGKNVVVQGLDQNGIPVIGVDPVTAGASSGETIVLALPFVSSAFQYEDVTGLLKQPTNGPVKFFTVDPVTQAETALSSMDPNETTASYRQYLFNGLQNHCCTTPNGLIQVQAQCRLDFIPVFNDTDYLTIQSIPALIEECMARRYGRMDSPQAPAFEDKHHKRAIQILNGQLDLYLGKTRVSVSVPIWGSSKLQRQPV